MVYHARYRYRYEVEVTWCLVQVRWYPGTEDLMRYKYRYRYEVEVRWYLVQVNRCLVQVYVQLW
jgi:hypothetical protein